MPRPNRGNELKPLPPGAGGVDGWFADSYAYGVSRDGSTVTGEFRRSDGYSHGFVWTEASGMVDMGSSGASSAIYAANADGSVVVGADQRPATSTHATDMRAAVWVRGVMSLLDGENVPGKATAVNGDGTIIVGMSGYRPAIWKWQDGIWARAFLLPLDAKVQVWATNGRAVSDDGQFVVGPGQHRYGSQREYGFVWTPTTGVIDANTYLKSVGYPVTYSIHDFYAITPNAQTVVVAGGCGTSTCVVRRAPSTAAAPAE